MASESQPISRYSESRSTHSGYIPDSRSPLLRFLEIQPPCIVGIELLNRCALDIALLEVLIVIQVAVVGRDGVEVAHVDGLRRLLLRQERLVHLFAVADADDLDFLLVATEEFAHGLGLRLNRTGWHLLDQDSAILTMC